MEAAGSRHQRAEKPAYNAEVVLDFTELEIPSQMKANIRMLRYLKKDKAITMNGLATAIVMKKSNLAVRIFAELYAFQRGLDLRVFQHKHEAISWVKRVSLPEA